MCPDSSTSGYVLIYFINLLCLAFYSFLASSGFSPRAGRVPLTVYCWAEPIRVTGTESSDCGHAKSLYWVLAGWAGHRCNGYLFHSLPTHKTNIPAGVRLTASFLLSRCFIHLNAVTLCHVCMSSQNDPCSCLPCAHGSCWISLPLHPLHHC